MAILVGSTCNARQTRFIVSDQPHTRFTCGRAVIIYYLLLPNATARKNGCVIAWQAIMTVEVAGPRGSGH